MDAKKGNGPDAPHDRPAKTLTKYAANFTAHAASIATVSNGFNVLFFLLVLQNVAMVWEVLK